MIMGLSVGLGNGAGFGLTVYMLTLIFFELVEIKQALGRRTE
jgi:hypothetical protein